MSKFYTGTGDNGFSCGLPKSSPIFDLLGALDSLQTYLGIVKCTAKEYDNQSIIPELTTIQNKLFIIQAHCYNNSEERHIKEQDIADLEKWIKLYRPGYKIDSFILSSSTSGISAHLDFARTLARTAEREFWKSAVSPRENKQIIIQAKYLNRLSSYLYVMSRYFDVKAEKVSY